ncbi:hypothetical protein L798_04327 [Zootermopsis nevadensis]|uniref:C2H2-type domain-containing protein n=2 Tax=Zootermopsis nevadensis TaxID=136037 RepID=A0A067RU86_ZOONE|nr:hypothetical protein L798_04327 [Zootermopsis nevadensis]
MDFLSKEVSLDVSVKNISAASIHSVNGDHCLLVGKELRQRKDCLLLNDNTVVQTSSSFSDNPLTPGRSEVALSDWEGTLRVDDEFQDAEVPSCGHSEILYGYHSKQLVIEETDNEISEVLPLLEGSTCSESLEISKNYATVKESVLETTVSCPEIVIHVMKEKEINPVCGGSEVNQLLHCDCNVKEVPNSKTSYDISPKSPSVQPSSPDMTIRDQNLSQTHENSMGRHAPHKEDSSSLYVKLISSSGHSYSRSVVPLVSESQTIPKHVLLHQQKFCDSNGEDKLPIAATGNENKQNCKPICDKSKNTEELQNKNSLLITGAKSATIQDNVLILSSQKTVELKSSTGHYQTSDELESEIAAHDYQVIDCELQSAVTKLPFQDASVADCKTCHLDSLNLSKNTSSERQEDSSPKEKLITGINGSPDDTESQNMEHLQKNVINISYTEQNIGTIIGSVADDVSRVDSSITGSDGDISCLEQNVVGSVTATGVSDPVVDDDDGDDAAVTTTVVAVVSHEDGGDHDAVPGNADATTGDHYDGTNSDTDDVASTTTTAFTASTDSIHDYDDAEIGNDGVAVSTAASAATTTTDEADTAGNVVAYTSCKDQSKVTCLNPCVTDADTTTATTIVGDANTTTAVTTVCNADTFADTTSTITTTIASSTVSSATDITPDDTDDANTADDKVDVHIASVITVAAVATSATITTVTITAAAATTTTPTSSATTTFAATTTTTTTTATAATITTNDDCDGSGGGGGVGSSSSSKDSGVTESLVSYAVEEDWQYEANIQCVSINQMASRSQETERNGAGMEQRHITSLVTSGSVTVEEEDTVKLSVSTTENQKCYQPKGKLGTTLNIELEPNCKLSAEVNHNESQKSITPCKGPTSPAYSSHGTCHTECDYTRKLLGDPKTAESKSQQQDKSTLEEISHEMDSVANRVKPLQLQCQFTVEPTKDELNNYVHKLHGDSSAFSFREECLSLEEMRNSLLDMTHDVPVQQEHYCLEDSVKDEICNFELNVPADTPVQPEFKSSNRIIKDEINCEINIASGNVSIPHEYYSPLELNKEEIGDFKINMPENVSCCLSAEQDSSEDLDKARIASCTLHISAESSLKEECLSVQEINSKPNSPISENSELVQNNTLILTNTERTVELVQSNMSTQNSPHRQEADLSVDTDDMPHLEVIDRDVSPNSSDSLEMPCLELITDCVQPMGSDVQCPGDISASASSVPPLHIFPESIHTNAKGNSTELGINDAEELQENDSLTLKVTMLSQHSMHESEHHRNREMSVHSQDQVINSTDIELPKKHLSSVSTTGKTYFGLEEENFTEDFVIHEDPPVEGHILSVSHNTDVLQDDQKRYLSTESLVTEECGGSIVKAVECEIQEVSVTPETLQDISGYLDSGTASVKVVEVSPEYMQVLHTDVSGGWNSVHLVTSDMTCSTSCEKTQTDTKDILTDEEVLASTDVGNTKLPGNFEHETLLMSVELNESATETSFNIEAAGTIYLTDKENDALSSVCSENVNLTTDALPDISVEPSSLVYSVLPGLDPSLGEIMPIDSVSNWPYLEEEVFSGLLATETDSSSSVPIGPCLTAVLSIPGSNSEDTAKSESSLFSDCNRQYNFHTQSDSNDAPVAINGLKCRLSWKKIFALSKGDKKRKQETKKGENPKVTSENFKCANSGQQLKEYSEICHASDNIKLVNKCERLNGNLNRHIDLKDERISGLELGPAKIEVRLPPSPSPRGHLKAWRVIDGPKAERVLDQGGSKTVLSDASAGNISCRSVARAVEPLTSELTQMPIVLVKRLILKRRCDDDDDGAGSDMKKKKKKKLNCRELSDPITRSLGNDGFTQVTVSSEQIEVPDESVCDFVTPHGRRLQDSEHLNGLQERCDSSNSTLMNNSSLSPQIETQAAVRRDSSNSESEEDQSSHTSIESNSGEAECCKCCSSSTCILSEGKCLDGIATPADTYKTHDDCIDDSKPFDIGINLNISYNELPSANSSVSSEDNTKQQLPRVIIKRTVGMGNTNKYQSFLRSVSSSDESCNRWQPIVQLERNLSLDELAKNSSVNNGTLKAAKMPDNLRHGLKISLKSAPGHPYVTLVPLPSLPCSPVDKNKSHSERAKKRRCGIIPSRIRSRHGDVNHWNPQRRARKFTSLKSSSFYVRHDHDPCLMSLPTDNRQLPSPKSCRSQRSPPIKLKLFNGSSRVKNGTLKMDKNISVTGNCGDGGDEYVVVENRNYTKDSMTKITFQRHKRKEVSVRKECNEIEMKVNKFKSDLDIPAVPDKNILSVHEIETICSEDSSSIYDLTVPSQGTVQRRLSIEFDQETSKKELHHFHKKHMPNISHAIDSSGQEIATVLEDTGDMVSEDCSQSDAAILNYMPSAALQPETVQSRAALHDGYPKISKTKKRQYFDDVYLDKDVLPLFQPDRILSVSSTKKKQSNPKMKCPKLDGKALEEEIISLSADVHMDYSDIFCKQVMDDTVVKSKGGQKCSTEGCFGTYPRAEECPEETLSSKDDGLVLVSSSKESEPELHVLNDCGTECVGSSSILEEEEEQKLWSDIQPNVVESTEQGDDACQACGHIYSSRDERTLHIRRHPYHCQRCHLAFKSEVDFVSHLSERHPRTRERHHCLLCERSFPTAERYKLHLSGRAHRHLELTQRRTIHTLFSIFTGHSCPVLTPLSDSELAGLKWFPVEPGTIHFYHQATPLQRAMQDLLLQKEGSYTDAAGSNNRTPEDYPSKSGDSS